MKINLTLVAADADGDGHVVTAEVTIALDAMEGLPATNAGALDVILLRLREAGLSVE
jgi:hypothetical protein